MVHRKEKVSMTTMVQMLMEILMSKGKMMVMVLVLEIQLD